MHDQHVQAAPASRRQGISPILAIAGVLLTVLFAGLGTWQVYRLQWKLDLIARVDARVHAAPAAPPPRARWAQVTPQSDEYRNVRLVGTYLYEFTTPVQALSELGSGYWLITPLCTADGNIVLVNRGFVPLEQGGPKHYPARRAQGAACPGAGAQATLTGLLRISEPGGGFLRHNDPAGNRWYSRDVAAIAASHGLAGAAPYFVDAARGQDPAGAPDHPTGGLTVISFPNTHLVYALTWYALALMVAGALWWAARRQPEAHDAEDE
jgi:surfeit locus 1 family protein